MTTPLQAIQPLIRQVEGLGKQARIDRDFQGTIPARGVTGVVRETTGGMVVLRTYSLDTAKLDEALFCARICREHGEWEDLQRYLELAAHEARTLRVEDGNAPGERPEAPDCSAAWRLLDKRDAICPGDELLGRDRETWEVINPKEWAIGMRYDANLFVPMRRKRQNAELTPLEASNDTQAS